MINRASSSNRYFDPAVQAWAVKVDPGSWELSAHAEQLVATLASAVALIVWDSNHGRAAMTHFMVEPFAAHDWTNDSLPSPHADALLDTMWKTLSHHDEGGKPEYHAFVVGGGTILLNGQMVVGQANVMKAVDWLHKRSIPMEHYDVGQAVLRKVFFNPVNGELAVRRIIATRNDTVRQREEDYLDQLQPQTTKEYDQ